MKRLTKGLFALGTLKIRITLIIILGVLGLSFILLLGMLQSFFGDDDDEDGSGERVELSGELGEIGKKEIPEEYIEIYKKASEKYGLEEWLILPAIHRVETEFGNNLAVSYAGAVGHFQFMPCTWQGWGSPTCGGLGRGNIDKEKLKDKDLIKKYNGYGVDANNDGKADPWDIEDAVYSAAKYIKENKKNGGRYNDPLKNAVFMYNHADFYVNDVMGYYETYSNGYSAKKIDENGGKGKGKVGYPLVGTIQITSEFGLRDLEGDGNEEEHNGIDFACSNGVTPIVSAGKGEVVFAEPNEHATGGYGKTVIVKHSGIYTHYAHMSSLNVSVGDKVKQGDKVGVCGSTGQSTGPHLHFETKTEEWSGHKNPRDFLGKMK